MFNTLITDRTEADVLRWKVLRDKGWENMTETERAEWSAGLKGAYNATDLNRVGKALNYLRVELAAAGYLNGDEFEMPEIWNKTHVPTAESFSAYLKAVDTIRATLAKKPDTPFTPTDNGSLDYQGANDIEKILFSINESLELMRAHTQYCFSDLYCGEI